MTDIERPLSVTPVRPPSFSWRGFGITAGVLFIVLTPILLVAILSDKSMADNPAVAVAIAIFAAAISSIIYGAMFYFPTILIRRWMFNFENRMERITKSSEDLQGALEQDFVTNLVRINFKYIDAYYLQTRIQADKSFTVTVVAASVSLALILIGIALMYFGGISATPATATAGAPSGAVGIVGGQATAAATLSAAAGILGQFISAVFFYLYNQTVAKMADYHRKLVFTQNIGLALKISDGLPAEEKTKAQLKLIETLSKDINQFLKG